jgi:hypothetical protein
MAQPPTGYDETVIAAAVIGGIGTTQPLTERGLAGALKIKDIMIRAEMTNRNATDILLGKMVLLAGKRCDRRCRGLRLRDALLACPGRKNDGGPT